MTEPTHLIQHKSWPTYTAVWTQSRWKHAIRNRLLLNWRIQNLASCGYGNWGAARSGVILLMLLSGCGGSSGVTGGTEGVLHSGPDRLAELRVTIHRVDGPITNQIGFGETRMDGTFNLVTNGAQQRLRLTPGDYRCTLESVGYTNQIPSALMKPETTPLKITWTAADALLDLDIRELTPIR